MKVKALLGLGNLLLRLERAKIFRQRKKCGIEERSEHRTPIYRHWLRSLRNG